MRTVFDNCSKGQASDVPDAMITDSTSYNLYEDEVMEQKSIVNKQLGDAMFDTVNFRGKPVIWSSQCTSGYMYFVNFSYVGLNVDPDINFTATEWKSIPNQLDRVMQIVWKGNAIASRRASLGVLTSIAA